MRRSLFLFFLGLFPLLLTAQEFSSSTPTLKIMNMDFPEYSKLFTSKNSPLKYFNTLIGDTILFRGSTNREDFFKSDTLWLKPGAKKPIEGKHYKITKHYKTSDNDYTTPNQYVYNRPWIIIACEEGRDNSFLDSEIMTLKDAETGDIVKWRYLFNYYFSKNIDVVDLTKSHEITQYLKKLSLYDRVGDHFNEIKVVNALMTIKSDFFLI